MQKNIYRTKAYNSIICKYFYIGFIDPVLKSRSLLDYTNLFTTNEYEKDDKIIIKYFRWLKNSKMKQITKMLVKMLNSYLF